MTQVIELEIPAQPEFVGIARMAVAALAGVRPGLEYERVDDLRIVVSEACTSAIEAIGASTGESGAR
ncbi:MAG: anti-sigma B factor RsbW, partial [Actinomycetota bacterium]